MDASRISLTSSMEVIDPDEQNESSSELDASWYDVGSAGGSSPTAHTRANSPQPSHNRETHAPRPSYANYLHHRLRELLMVDEPDGDDINAFTLSQRISHVLREELATLFWKADGIELQRQEENATYCGGAFITHKEWLQERNQKAPQTMRQSAYEMTFDQLREVTAAAERILSEARITAPSAGWKVLADNTQWRHEVDTAVRTLLFHSRWLEDFHFEASESGLNDVIIWAGGRGVASVLEQDTLRDEFQNEKNARRHLWAGIDERLNGASERAISAPPLSATDTRQRVARWLGHDL